MIPLFFLFLIHQKSSIMLYPPTKPYTGKRVGATLIDYTLTFALTFVYIYAVGTPNEEGGYSVNGFPALAPMAFWFLYFVVAEYFWQGTLGHQVFGLKVISADNRPLSFGQVLLRRIADVLEIAWCFGLIAFILVKSTEHAQRLGDLWARTLVTGKNAVAESPFDFDKGL
jgi:uncharacterized RDD family membrane protein YckC